MPCFAMVSPREGLACAACRVIGPAVILTRTARTPNGWDSECDRDIMQARGAQASRTEERSGMRMEDEDQRLENEVSLLLTRDRLMRSQILYEAIDLEAAVERIVAFHFCPDPEKHDLFVSLLFREGEVTFSQKIKMLRKLLKLCYPTVERAFAFLPKHLEKLRKLRNEFAHLRLDFPAKPGSTNLDAEEIKLRTLKDGQAAIRTITRAEVDEVVEQCRHVEMAAIFLGMFVRRAAIGESDADFAATIIALATQLEKRLKASNPRPNSR